MIVHETPLADCRLIEPERHRDERGYFARTFCRGELARAGVGFEVAQANVSSNRRAGTLRGMHWQAPPHAEGKIVSVVRGAVFDAVVDLRPGSPSFRGVFTVELTADKGRELYVPPGFAHGFETLADDTLVHYLMSVPYAPGAGRGFRFDDPEVAIPWPRPPAVISERDRELPLLAEVVAKDLGDGA